MSWTSSSFSTDNAYIKYRIEVTENNTDQTLNTSNVTVKVWVWRTNTGYETYGSGYVYCTIDSTKYSATVKSSQKITENGIYLFSKTLNITHDSDGKKELTISAYIDHNRVSSNSNSFNITLSTIPRCSKLSASSVVLGQKMTITITRDNNTFVDTVYWKCGDRIEYLAKMYTGTSLTWTPPIDLAAEYPNVENIPIYLFCDTYTSEGNLLGTISTTVQCTVPASIVPTISVDISDNSGSFDEYKCFLQGFSTMQVKITAEGLYGATIVSYTSIIDGKTYTGSEFTTEVINASGTITAQITVRDSRGRTATLDYEFEVILYTAPKVTSLTAIRCDENGNEYYQGQYCKLTFSAEITSLGGLNSASYRVEYKKQDESTFSSMTASAYDGQISVSNGTVMFAAENGSSYNVYLYAVDNFGESSKYVFSPSVFRLIHFGADGQTIAFFKRCEGDVPGDFGQPIRLSGGYIPAPIGSVVTMDNLTNSGFYVSTGLFVENAPFYGDYSVEVRKLADDGTSIMQKAEQYGEDGLSTLVRYRRILNDVVTWTEWKELYALPEHRHNAEDIVQNGEDAVALINAMKTVLVDTIYPVGSIYISTNSATPESLFGGTWTQINDKFLLAAGSLYSAGDEGGSASYNLSIDAHKHLAPVGYNSGVFGIIDFSSNGTSTAAASGYKTTNANVGNSTGSASNITKIYTKTAGAISKNIPTIPPYFAVNVWQRIS